MKSSLCVNIAILCMVVCSSAKPASIENFSSTNDSVILRVDSVVIYSGCLKINISIINNSRSEISIVKPVPEFLDYNIISIDFIDKNNFKKGFNSTQISKNLQIDKVSLKDSSNFLFIQPNAKQITELIVSKEFFGRKAVFDFVKQCYLAVWYFHDAGIFKSPIHTDKIYNGTLSSVASSVVKNADSLTQ